MFRLIIGGGKKLSGYWRVSGNKNEALPLIAASLLFKDGIILKNVPKIKDVEVMNEIANFINKGNKFIPNELSSKIRGSLLFLAPLLYLYGKAIIPKTGGDKIGLRKIDTHLEVFKSFGAKINGNKISLSKSTYQSRKNILVWISEPSVTATENALMLSALRPGKTIIKNAACEPHIVGLGNALKKGGAKIKGLGSNIIEVWGAKKLKKIIHNIDEDFMELGSALVISALFGGKVKVETKNFENYKKIFEVFEKFNKKVIKTKSAISVVSSKRSGITNKNIYEISDGPWPSFPSDLISPLIVLATQSFGAYLFHEKMFESRLYFTDQLKTMGAKITLCDPHRVLVWGPSNLYGTHLTSPDIRAGMALIIAALIARGISIVDNAHQIERGYENLITKLKNIGADIKAE